MKYEKSTTEWGMLRDMRFGSRVWLREHAFLNHVPRRAIKSVFSQHDVSNVIEFRLLSVTARELLGDVAAVLESGY